MRRAIGDAIALTLSLVVAFIAWNLDAFFDEDGKR